MNTVSKRTQNILLILAVIVLALIPLWIVEKPAAGPDGEEVAIFGGSDDKAKNLIGEIRPDYQPWFEPIFRPASSEVESGLFALQAAIGGCVLGFVIGALWGRRRATVTAAQISPVADLTAAAPADPAT